MVQFVSFDWTITFVPPCRETCTLVLYVYNGQKLQKERKKRRRSWSFFVLQEVERVAKLFLFTLAKPKGRKIGSRALLVVYSLVSSFCSSHLLLCELYCYASDKWKMTFLPEVDTIEHTYLGYYDTVCIIPLIWMINTSAEPLPPAYINARKYPDQRSWNLIWSMYQKCQLHIFHPVRMQHVFFTHSPGWAMSIVVYTRLLGNLEWATYFMNETSVVQTTFRLDHTINFWPRVWILHITGSTTNHNY